MSCRPARTCTGAARSLPSWASMRGDAVAWPCHATPGSAC